MQGKLIGNDRTETTTRKPGTLWQGHVDSQQVTLQQIYTLKCVILYVLLSQINYRYVGSETQLNNQKLSVKHIT